MKLGDFIFYITKYTGIKWLVDWYSKKLEQIADVIKEEKNSMR